MLRTIRVLDATVTLTLPLAGMAVSEASVPAGAPVPAATAQAAQQGNRSSYAPDITPDGRYVAFASDATNLVPGDTNGRRDIFVRHVVAKTTRCVSVRSNGAQLTAHSYSPTIGGNGRCRLPLERDQPGRRRHQRQG